MGLTRLSQIEFKSNLSLLQTICTLSPDDDHETKVCPYSVAVTHEDDILVGDVERWLITTHSRVNGWVAKKVQVPIKPTCLAVNSQKHILVSDWEEAKLVVVSLEGCVLFTLNTFRFSGREGQPGGIVCDTNDNIYIGISDRCRYPFHFHIHLHNKEGLFLKCFAKNLYRAYGMKLSENSLWVANGSSIVMFRLR